MAKERVVEKKLGRHKTEGYPVVGLAHFDENLIEIDPRQNSKDYLDTAIHEKLHLMFPNWEHDLITPTANKLTKYLWKMGYRKVNLK